MVKKQTAVEWLVQTLEEKYSGFLDSNKEIIQGAKEMEKEQIEDAFGDGKWDWDDYITKGIVSKDLVEYYKETYG